MTRSFKTGLDAPAVSVNGTAVSVDGHTHAGGGVTDATYVTLTTNGTLSDERVLTAGSYVTITDGGAGSTVTVAVDATSANTASKVVARDSSGNFSAGTITASLTGTASGNIANSLVTTVGDLIIGAGSPAVPTRLAIGANTYVLTSNGTTASWAAPTGGSGSTSVATLIKWGM